MSLQSHFNPREGPPHPPSPLQFPGMSSALTLTPPHHSKRSFLYIIYALHMDQCVLHEHFHQKLMFLFQLTQILLYEGYERPCIEICLLFMLTV